MIWNETGRNPSRSSALGFVFREMLILSLTSGISSSLSSSSASSSNSIEKKEKEEDEEDSDILQGVERKLLHELEEEDVLRGEGDILTH